MPPLADRRARAVAGFEDGEGQAALVQVRGGGQADRAGADHHDGQVVHGVHQVTPRCGGAAWGRGLVRSMTGLRRSSRTTSRHRPWWRPDPFADADHPEAGPLVQGEAGGVLREDPGLDGPDAGRLGRGDQRVQQQPGRRPRPPGGGVDVDGVFDHPGVDRAGRGRARPRSSRARGRRRRRRRGGARAAGPRRTPPRWGRWSRSWRRRRRGRPGRSPGPGRRRRRVMVRTVTSAMGGLRSTSAGPPRDRVGGGREPERLSRGDVRRTRQLHAD